MTESPMAVTLCPSGNGGSDGDGVGVGGGAAEVVAVALGVAGDVPGAAAGGLAAAASSGLTVLVALGDAVGAGGAVGVPGAFPFLREFLRADVPREPDGVIRMDVRCAGGAWIRNTA